MQLNKAREKLIQMYMDSLKEEKLPWKKPWNDEYRINHHNPISKTQYHGVNNELLNVVATSKGYEDPRWLTFNQIKDQGWSLQNAKGQGVPVEFWSVYNKVTGKTASLSEYNAAVANDPESIKDYSIVDRTYYVFNASLVNGIPEFHIEEQTKKLKDPSLFIETLISSMGVDYQEGGNRAFYQPYQDKVTVPESHQFHGQYEYDSTRLHELCHATGHPSRLNRNIANYFGGTEYAKEELRAEISASFLAQDITVIPSQIELDNHKAYIQNWIQILSDEPNELFKAIKDAEKICGYILKNGKYEEFCQLQNKQESLKNAAKIFPMPLDKFPVTLAKIWEIKDAYTLFELGVPLCVEYGYVDKNMYYYTEQEIEAIGSKMSFEEDEAFWKENEIKIAGHKIVEKSDFSILANSHAQVFIDPESIPVNKMSKFINTYNYLTKKSYCAFDENTYNRIQKLMHSNKPMTYEKIMNMRDKYLTDEIIEKMSKEKEWIEIGERENIDPKTFIEEHLGLSRRNDDKAQKMDLDEYLAIKGVSAPVSDFLTDKMRGNRQLSTDRGQKAFNKAATSAANSYYEDRQRAKEEYKELIDEGKLMPKTQIERMIETAHGHPDLDATHAARRMLAKRGVSWKTGEAITDKMKLMARDMYVEIMVAEELGEELHEELDNLSEAIDQFIDEIEEGPNVSIQICAAEKIEVKKTTIDKDTFLTQAKEGNIDIIEALKSSLSDDKQINFLDNLQQKLTSFIEIELTEGSVICI